jgi:uncharacterized membrane protein
VHPTVSLATVYKTLKILKDFKPRPILGATLRCSEGLKFQPELITQQLSRRWNAAMTDVVEKGLKKIGVTLSKPVLGIVTIIFGLLIIILPLEFLKWIIGIFLIVQGALLLSEYYELLYRPASRT